METKTNVGLPINFLDRNKAKVTSIQMSLINGEGERDPDSAGIPDFS